MRSEDDALDCQMMRWCAENVMRRVSVNVEVFRCSCLGETREVLMLNRVRQMSWSDGGCSVQMVVVPWFGFWVWRRLEEVGGWRLKVLEHMCTQYLCTHIYVCIGNLWSKSE